MVWSDPLSTEEYVAFQLAALAFLLHKKGMRESSQRLIGVRADLLRKMDETMSAQAEAASEFQFSDDESTAPAK